MTTRKSLALVVGLVLSASQAAASPLVTAAGTIDVERFDLTGSAPAVDAFSDHVTVYSQSRDRRSSRHLWAYIVSERKVHARKHPRGLITLRVDFG